MTSLTHTARRQIPLRYPAHSVFSFRHLATTTQQNHSGFSKWTPALVSTSTFTSLNLSGRATFATAVQQGAPTTTGRLPYQKTKQTPGRGSFKLGQATAKVKEPKVIDPARIFVRLKVPVHRGQFDFSVPCSRFSNSTSLSLPSFHSFLCCLGK